MCLLLFVVMSVSIHVGGSKLVRELKPSALELEVPENTRMRVQGQVYQIEIREDYQILYLQNNSIHVHKQSLNESRMILYDDTKEQVKIGNRVEAEGKLSFYQSARNPGNFDQKLYYQRQNIHGSVWASRISVKDRRVFRWRNELYEFRLRCRQVLMQALGKKDGSVMSAILLGEKSELDADMKTLYQVNGIGHILAISGLHLSVIGIGMYRIFRRVSGSYPVGGIAGICFLLVYIMMIGWTVSVVRAMIMFLFRIGADMTGRHYDSLTALSVAAVAVLLWRPLYLYDGGFWLSFGAVLAVILVLPVFAELPLQGFWASVSINVVVLPLILYYFYEFPVYSVLLNLLVIPLMSALLFLGLAGGVLAGITASGIFAAPGSMILQLCKGILWIYEKSCEVFVELPGARLVAGKPELWQVVCYYVCLFAVFLWLRILKKEKEQYKKNRHRNPLRKKLLAAGIIAAGVSVLLAREPVRESVNVTVLDVGQGDSIFIRGPEGGTYLVDGGSSDVKKAGQYRIEPFLKSQGVGALDYVFVSHGDSDHLSGIREMLGRQNVGVKIRHLVLPEQCFWDEELTSIAKEAAGQGIPVIRMEQGERFTEEKLSLSCIHPAAEDGSEPGDEATVGTYEPGNEASMVLALQYGEFDMLLTGDVEGAGEDAVTEELQKGGDSHYEVLKVAHHGSKNSTGEEFLKTVDPAVSIISAGEGNRYGHPHAETMERLEETGSRIYTTAETGAITIRIRGAEGHEAKLYCEFACENKKMPICTPESWLNSRGKFSILKVTNDSDST